MLPDLSNLHLKTPRISLKELAPEDFGALHAYSSDADFLKYQNWGPNTEEQTQAYLAECIRERVQKPRRKFNLAITARVDGRYLGNIALLIADSFALAEVGFNIARAEWGQGFASEAGKALLAFAFNILELPEIVAYCDPANTASRKVLERMGLEYVEILKEHRKVRRLMRDSASYRICRVRFLSNQRRVPDRQTYPVDKPNQED